MKLRRVLGGVLIVLGLLTALYGGFLGAIYTTDGGQPHYVAAVVLFVVGLVVAGAGMVVAGVVDWDEMRRG